MTPPYSIHRGAVAELRAAARWYTERSPAAAMMFLSAIDAAISAATASPLAWPRLDDRGVRKVVLSRFPFAVIYRLRPTSHRIRILAIAHTSRDPDYWRTRQ